jgi:uncharacterized Zn finger protein
MPNTNRPLLIECPSCHHRGCTLVVKSLTVMTVRCAECQHMWATRLDWLPLEIQDKVRALEL